MIQLTDAAIDAIWWKLEVDDTITYFRVGCKGGGCSGYSVSFDYEMHKKSTDLVFQYNRGIVVIIDPKSFKLLDGSTIDYQKSLMKSGFTITSPNIQSKCGCGKSVSFK